MTNRAAQALSRRARNVPKKFSRAEIAKRTQRLFQARAALALKRAAAKGGAQ